MNTPVRPKQAKQTSKFTPIVKPVSTKPSDRPMQMAMKGIGGVTRVPKIPALAPKKITGSIKPKTRRPSLGMK